jgi:hypothetical protein
MYTLVIHTLTFNGPHADAIEAALEPLSRQLGRLEGVVRVLPCYSESNEPVALLLTTWASAEIWQSMRTSARLSSILRWPAAAPAFSVRSEQTYDYLWGFYRPGPDATYLALVTARASHEPNLRACARQFTLMPGISSAFLAREQTTHDITLAVTFGTSDIAGKSQLIQRTITAHLPQRADAGVPATPLFARILPGRAISPSAADERQPIASLSK